MVIPVFLCAICTSFLPRRVARLKSGTGIG